MQDSFRKWCQFKNVYEKEKAEILAIEDETKRQEELDNLNATQEEWKLRAMGTTIGGHTVFKKGTEGNDIKTYDLTKIVNPISRFCYHSVNTNGGQETLPATVFLYCSLLFPTLLYISRQQKNP